MGRHNTQKIEIWVCVYGKYLGSFYPSLNSAAKDLNLQVSHISEVLAGKRKQHKGYTFRPVYYGYYERRRENV